MKYALQDKTVDAVQVIQDNRTELTALDPRVRNVLVEGATGTELAYCEIVYEDGSATRADIGMWIVLHDTGELSLLTNGLFEETYQPSVGEA